MEKKTKWFIVDPPEARERGLKGQEKKKEKAIIKGRCAGRERNGEVFPWAE